MVADAAASGWKELQVSCTKSGDRLRSLRTAPPTVSCASSSSTCHPASASRFAATSPLGPPPTTTASTASESRPLSARCICSLLPGCLRPYPRVRALKRERRETTHGTHTASPAETGCGDRPAGQAGCEGRARRRTRLAACPAVSGLRLAVRVLRAPWSGPGDVPQRRLFAAGRDADRHGRRSRRFDRARGGPLP